MKRLKQLFFIVLFSQCLIAFAQAQPKLKDIVSPMDTLQSRLPIEKVYLQTDKPNYASGDTIWFKAYLLNGDYLTPSTRSGLLYIELDDLDNKCVKRIMAPVLSGLSWGNIALNPEDIPDGSYILRAYTNWMRNFGEDYVFKKQLYITSLTNDPLLIGIRNKQMTSGLKDSIMTSLFFTGINKHPVLLQDMQLNVLEGKRRLYRFKASTSFDGQVSLSYALSAKMDTRKLMIQAQEINKKDNARQWLLPVAINRPEKIDLQLIRLLSKKPHLLLNTLTGNDGRFTFKGFAPVDTASFFIQAFNKHEKSFNIGIEVDEFTPPVFAQTAMVQRPWYLNTDTATLQNLHSIQAKQVAVDKIAGLGRVLKQVNIVSKKIVKGSHNLNGPGEADQVLDEKTMEKAGKKTLGNLLEEKVAGYHVMGVWSPKPVDTPIPMDYMVKDRKIVFLFDGMPLEYFKQSMDDYDQYIKDYLDYYTAEDIKGIEVMTSEHYTSSYGRQYLYQNAHITQWAFIEITTRSGAGPVLKKTPGIYVYKPLPFSMPKQFYRPRYTVKDKPNGTDVRSTIHWSPNIITDKEGKAFVSFYAADIPGSYTLTLEGSDMNGSLESTRQKIIVK